MPLQPKRWQHCDRCWRFCSSIILALTLMGLGGYRFVGRKKNLSAFKNMNIARLTTALRAREVAISPDGKYVAYVTAEAGKAQSSGATDGDSKRYSDYWQPTEGYYGGLTFSPDVELRPYYVRSPSVNSPGTLYQIPTLGGESRKVMERVDSPVAFSPEGKRVAFARENPGAETAVVVAGGDGSRRTAGSPRERSLTYLSVPGMAWSPDGKRIAIGTYSGGLCYVMTVQVEDGSVKRIGSKGWRHVLRVAWLSDSSGLVLGAQESPNRPVQLWELSYPDGQARRITNDLNDYLDLDLTADSLALVSVLREVRSNLWLESRDSANQGKQISFGAATQDGMFGLAWTAEGRIAYASLASGGRELWVVDPDGAHSRQLTSDADLQFFSTPSSCPDGSIVFASGAIGAANIWSIDQDGGNRKTANAGGYQRRPLLLRLTGSG